MSDGFLFFDSYAIIELMEGSPNYECFADSLVVTTKMNLFEVYYAFMRKGKPQLGNLALEYYYGCTVDIDASIIVDAVKIKLLLKKQRLSMVDCLGYILASRMGLRFLTGDKEFEGLANVEFVK